jgi:hypothetical protein
MREALVPNFVELMNEVARRSGNQNITEVIRNVLTYYAIPV